MKPLETKAKTVGTASVHNFFYKKYSFCCLITDIKRLSSNVDKM